MRLATVFKSTRPMRIAGKSGLNLDDRDALKELIDDVQSGATEFSTILVYDVSRWGGFQDADESAYYEYICKRAGISVRYCAEQFENDGSPVSTIVRGLNAPWPASIVASCQSKSLPDNATDRTRLSSGWSRGVWAAAAVDRSEQALPKSELVRGEHKSIQTDRIVLIPGPSEELETIRFIYNAFVEAERTELEIADVLNRRGFVTDLGRPMDQGHGSSNSDQ